MKECGRNCAHWPHSGGGSANVVLACCWLAKAPGSTTRLSTGSTRKNGYSCVNAEVVNEPWGRGRRCPQDTNLRRSTDFVMDTLVSRCITSAPKPTWKSVSLTHIPCRMPASLRTTATVTHATVAHNMLDRLTIRRPHARKADHFLTRSNKLAAASHGASRTAELPS